MTSIVYTSNAGTTASYAKLLGERLNLGVYSADEAKSAVSGGSDVIYLGWLMASEIKGYKKAARLYNVVAVIGVGMGKTGSQTDEARKRNSVPAQIPLFTLQGGFDINKLHGIYKLMMGVMKKTAGKALAQKTNRTPDEDDMLDLLLNGGSRVSADNLKDVLDWYSNRG